MRGKAVAMSTEDSALGVAVPRPNLPLIERSELKVFAPAKVWEPVVTTPPLVAFAGDKFKTPSVILSPFGFEVDEIVPAVIDVPEVPEGAVPEVTSFVVEL
jgi:hypothetical protein